METKHNINVGELVMIIILAIVLELGLLGTLSYSATLWVHNTWGHSLPVANTIAVGILSIPTVIIFILVAVGIIFKNIPQN